MNRPTRRTGTSDRGAAQNKRTGKLPRPGTGAAPRKSVRTEGAPPSPAPSGRATRSVRGKPAAGARGPTRSAPRPATPGDSSGTRLGSGSDIGSDRPARPQRDYRVRRSGMSLSVKFMLIVSGMVAGLMLLFFLTVYVIAAKALEDEITARGAARVRSLANLGRVYIETIYNPDFVDSLLRRKDTEFRSRLNLEYYSNHLEKIRASGVRTEFDNNASILRGFRLNNKNPDYSTVDEVMTDIARAIIWTRGFNDPQSASTWRASRVVGGQTLAFEPPSEPSLLVPAFREWIQKWLNNPALGDFLGDNHERFREALQVAWELLDTSRDVLQHKLREAYHDDFMKNYVADIVGKHEEIDGVLFLRTDGDSTRVEQFVYPEGSRMLEGRQRDIGDVEISEGSGKVQFAHGVEASIDDHTGDSARHMKYRAAVLFNAAQVNGARNRLVMFLAAIALLAVVIGICVSYFMANGVTKPINTLVEDVVHVAQGDYDHRTRMKTTDEVGVLARTIDRMAEGLAEAREIAKERGKQQHELSIAEEVVIHLLPDSLPKIYGYDVYAFYNPSKEVGGDYYDFFEIDPNHVGMIVADVSGKGIPGAMVMTMARSVIRYEAMSTLSPRETFMRSNTHIARDIKRGMFVTAFYLVLNTQTAEMTVASAGHNPLLLWRASSGKIENINPNGIALGFDKGPIFDRTIKEDKVQLYSGDRVVLYTDGVVEAMSPDNEEYTDERFIELIESYPDANSNQLTNIIVQDVMDHQGHGEQSDDITIVTFKLL